MPDGSGRGGAGHLAGRERPGTAAGRLGRGFHPHRSSQLTRVGGHRSGLADLEDVPRGWVGSTETPPGCAGPADVPAGTAGVPAGGVGVPAGVAGVPAGTAGVVGVLPGVAGVVGVPAGVVGVPAGTAGVVGVLPGVAGVVGVPAGVAGMPPGVVGVSPGVAGGPLCGVGCCVVGLTAAGCWLTTGAAPAPPPGLAAARSDAVSPCRPESSNRRSSLAGWRSKERRPGSRGRRGRGSWTGPEASRGPAGPGSHPGWAWCPTPAYARSRRHPTPEGAPVCRLPCSGRQRPRHPYPPSRRGSGDRGRPPAPAACRRRRVLPGLRHRSPPEPSAAGSAGSVDVCAGGGEILELAGSVEAGRVGFPGAATDRLPEILCVPVGVAADCGRHGGGQRVEIPSCAKHQHEGVLAEQFADHP